MNRTEWNDLLAILPATANQVGALHGEFGRLGFSERDRAERLTLCADILGVDELGSMRELRQGQAGWLLKLLTTVHDRHELVELLSSPGEAGTPQPSLLAVLVAVVVRWRTTSLEFGGETQPATRNSGGANCKMYSWPPSRRRRGFASDPGAPS
jgi:hypothetical protein